MIGDDMINSKNIVGVKVCSLEKQTHVVGSTFSETPVDCEYEIFSATGGDLQDATIIYQFVEHSNGETTVWKGEADGTFTKNGELVTENTESVSYTTKERVLCRILSYVLDDFTGYAHNYTCEGGYASLSE